MRVTKCRILGNCVQKVRVPVLWISTGKKIVPGSLRQDTAYIEHILLIQVIQWFGMPRVLYAVVCPRVDAAHNPVANSYVCVLEKEIGCLSP